jgi:aspartyl/glutamyl-tRNA(Asn/Gln) amidotransferase C subunit
VKQSSISSSTVHKIAVLANIPVTPDEENNLATAFTDTLEVVAHMGELDTTTVEPTHQVTGLENVLREDEIDEDRMLSQDASLLNAHKKYQGYFVVDRVIDQE